MRNLESVPQIVAEIDKERCPTYSKFARTIQINLHNDLDLTKGLLKPARWVSMMMTKKQKEERMGKCKDFLTIVHCHLIAC